MIPKTMKAMLLTGHGGVEKLEYTTDSYRYRYK